MTRRLAVATALTLAAWAQADLPQLVATRAEAPMHIDGRLTEPSWQAAFTATPFTLMGGAHPPTQATIGRVLYGANHLYFGFECAEANRDAMTTLIAERDGPVFLDDCVEAFIASGPDPMRYMHFVVNAAGVLRDELGRDEGWNSGALAAAGRTPGGWTVELAVPLADLGITASAGTRWRINLCREERPHAELSSWAPTQQGFHEPERFGWLTDLQVNVPRYARENLSRELRATQAALTPDLARARAALPLSAARAAADHGQAAEAALRRATALARPGRATVEELQQAEAALAEARTALGALQVAAPRVEMSLALRQRGLPTEYAVCVESSMARVRPDRLYHGEPARELSIQLAANEYEGAQVIVAPIEADLREVAVQVDAPKSHGAARFAGEVAVRRVGCVRVAEPSARSGAEPGLYPDPLPPNAAVDVPHDSTAAWLITAYAPPGQAPGEYLGRVTVTAANAPQVELPLRITVWGFELPRASALRTCFRLIPSYLWKHYGLPSQAGVPSGWEWGVWSGADVEGRPNYFGRGIFRPRFEATRPHSGRRAVCIEGELAEPGTHEGPRGCYHRLLPVAPNTEYTLTAWYRTEALADGLAQVHVHTHGVGQPLPAAADWTPVRLTFNSGEASEARIYLCNSGVGSAFFDDVALEPAAETATSGADNGTQKGSGSVVSPSEGFEESGEYEDRERLLRDYRLNSLAHRCSDMDVAAPAISVRPDGAVAIDWAEFDREIEFYLSRGLNAFNVHWARVPGGWGTVNAVDPQALALSAGILRQTQEHLAERGWLDLAYLYTIDEPGRDAFPDVKQAFEHVNRAAPRLKRLLTFGYGASRPVRPNNPLYRALEGYVDIWVPHSDCFEPEYLESRRRAGDEIWEYVCISAQKPYANMWGVDFPGSDPRVVFWQCYAEEITGFLYWATNYWEKDPWQDPLTYPGGNGDGSLLYPGPDGPIDSLRWETVRDGIEDYDYLRLLEGLAQQTTDPGAQRRARELLDVSPVTRSFTDYTTSPETIETQRARLGRTIEHLTAGRR